MTKEGVQGVVCMVKFDVWWIIQVDPGERMIIVKAWYAW
jgi:hypothetical protein